MSHKLESLAVAAVLLFAGPAQAEDPAKAGGTAGAPSGAVGSPDDTPMPHDRSGSPAPALRPDAPVLVEDVDVEASAVRLGDLSSTDIRRIQARLKKEGLYEGALDGTLGPKTRAGLREFSRLNLGDTAQYGTLEESIDARTYELLGLPRRDLQPVRGTEAAPSPDTGARGAGGAPPAATIPGTGTPGADLVPGTGTTPGIAPGTIVTPPGAPPGTPPPVGGPPASVPPPAGTPPTGTNP